MDSSWEAFKCAREIPVPDITITEAASVKRHTFFNALGLRIIKVLGDCAAQSEMITMRDFRPNWEHAINVIFAGSQHQKSIIFST